MTLEGTIVKKISWVYKLAGDLAAELDPTAVIEDGPKIHIDGSGEPCADVGEAGHLYDVPENLPTSQTEHEITCDSLEWSSVTKIVTGYNDLYGNRFSITWRKSEN